MGVKIKIYRADKLLAETEGVPGETVLQRLSAAGVFLDAPCGGRGRCGKCLVRLSSGGEEVRACQTVVDGGTDVYLPDEMKMKIAGQEPSAAAAAAAAGPLGVAIDIGTTTVVAHLTELATGARVATASGVNAQRPYGADVISRIEYSAAHGHGTLSRLIQAQLDGLIETALQKSGADKNDIHYIAIAGNTIMEHLAAGFSPVGMGTVPFEPVSLFGGELPAWDTLPAAKDAKIYFAPAISSYVGGDITAGMLYSKLGETRGPCVYIDIGTNGEIAMKLGEQYYCCATAAGPAFEGAEISKGMAAIS
ncbi:MAG: ASKHA domain-containing protein, partial [Oscillospiraceae bacterium]|nr:ASKHA domain-containing protein [Oscillospiraceae bacterium]